ncbi:hypothetical protein Pryu01_00520 [Paraliobacillus ryukyuensis]|uniref:Prepilin-type N-terminal cleavage/methylation domain-containing protein n=1 Tax=Paraliobacillus ryukyuensis TaxID=200904 RepID=A0A366EG89_9BACI|nr:type II secretion system protein [Paraliobacillus ryukyuensis]RBP01407.1 hypothetical protein DES48_101144 [Paraliobacillus ryukyuensis]
MYAKNKQNGFILSELIVTFSIIMMIAFTIVPVFYQLSTEHSLLQNRVEIQSLLHDQLLNQSFQSSTTEINHTFVEFTYTFEEPLWKGCAQWSNGKNNKESVCLYYYPKE